ncbi:MAG: hypothetical protein JW729_02495 [Bacteroidales bacterium]|nr:hypothetical protein [Bacteroidales bacterium]
MKTNELLDSISAQIDSTLSIEMRILDRKMPVNAREVQNAIDIVKKLQKVYDSEKEVDNFLKEQMEWLQDGEEFFKDPNALPNLLLQEMEDYATLELGNGIFPSNDEELEYWKYLFGFLKDCKPTDSDVQDSITEYTEFMSYYDGNMAVEFVENEIFDHIYTKLGKDGSKSPANKTELMQAMLLAIDPEDFKGLTTETLEKLKLQQEGFDYLMEKLEITQDDLDEYLAQRKKQIGIDMEENETNYGPNEQAYAFVNQMYESMSYVDKEGNRYATSLEEADLAESLIDKAEKAVGDSSDKELKEIIAANRAHIKEARTRSFTGAWWLIICAGIVVGFNFYRSFETIGMRINEATAINIINSQKTSLENTIATYEQKAELTKDEEKYLDKTKESLEEYRDMTPEDYVSDYKSRKIRSGLSGLLGALIGLGWIALYIYGSRPYGYMQFKRKREYEIIKKATGWGAKIVSGILGVFWSIPITTYVTKYTDGSEDRDSDALMVLGLQIGVTLVIVITIIYLAYAIMPFIAVFAYIRNYPEAPGAKQFNDLFRNGKGFVANYIDKLKKKAM